MCSRCIMDTTDKNISFNGDGVCNHCLEAEIKMPQYYFSKTQAEKNIENLGLKIKKKKRGEYDSIIGLSGGCDSSYVAYLAWEMGLNSLCVHFDNGWNSETAVSNIKKIVDGCGFDLITYVIDWPEFRDLQRAFLKASVIDIEMLTDHAHKAATLKFCKKYKIKYVLAGNSYTTEHGLPHSWSWNKQDAKQIKAIHHKFGEIKLKSYPFLGMLKFLILNHSEIGPTYVPILNKITYKKNEAINKLQKKFHWEYYGGKHFESVFTKFYQAYILPTKFNIDKRKVHLSALIRNNEITRQEALNELKLPLYDENEYRMEREFVLKKLGFTQNEFNNIMQQPPISHESYASQLKYFKLIINIAKRIKGKI